MGDTVIALLLLSIMGLPSESSLVMIQPDRSVALKAVLAKRSIVVTVDSMRVKPDSDLLASAVEGLTRPVLIIRKLAISVDGKELLVPRGVYVDWIDPVSISLAASQGQFVLSVFGGQTANIYRANVFFDAEGVTRTVLFSEFLPDEPLQEIRYWRRVLK